MRTGIGHDQGKFGIVLLPYQKPIPLDMAFQSVHGSTKDLLKHIFCVFGFVYPSSLDILQPLLYAGLLPSDIPTEFLGQFLEQGHVYLR